MSEKRQIAGGMFSPTVGGKLKGLRTGSIHRFSIPGEPMGGLGIGGSEEDNGTSRGMNMRVSQSYIASKLRVNLRTAGPSTLAHIRQEQSRASTFIRNFPNRSYEWWVDAGRPSVTGELDRLEMEEGMEEGEEGRLTSVEDTPEFWEEEEPTGISPAQMRELARDARRSMEDDRHEAQIQTTTTTAGQFATTLAQPAAADTWFSQYSRPTGE